MRVLLVEDDELLRLCLAEVLFEAGMQVREAADAEHALELAEDGEPPTIVVSDVNLGPGMDGFDLAAALHHRWPCLRVLLISGIATNVIGRDLGPFDRFLPKPFSCGTLLGAISELVQGSRWSNA